MDRLVSLFLLADLRRTLTRSQVMYEATLSQVYNLCNLAPMSTIDSGKGEFVDALACARLFWYAHITDGVTSGLRGGRILLYVRGVVEVNIRAYSLPFIAPTMTLPRLRQDFQHTTTVPEPQRYTRSHGAACLCQSEYRRIVALYMQLSLVL